MSKYLDDIRDGGTKRQRYFPDRDELLTEIGRVINERGAGGFKHVGTTLESNGQHKFYGLVLTFLPWSSNGRSCKGGHVEVFDTHRNVIKELMGPPDLTKRFSAPQIDMVLNKAHASVTRGQEMSIMEQEYVKRFIASVRDEIHLLATGKHLPTLANINWIVKRAQENTSSMFVGRPFSMETEEYLVKEIGRLAVELIDWNKEGEA